MCERRMAPLQSKLCFYAVENPLVVAECARVDVVGPLCPDLRAPAIHNFRVPVRSVTYPPGGGLLAVLWPQGWVYWPNNGQTSTVGMREMVRKGALVRHFGSDKMAAGTGW